MSIGQDNSWILSNSRKVALKLEYLKMKPLTLEKDFVPQKFPGIDECTRNRRGRSDTRRCHPFANLRGKHRRWRRGVQSPQHRSASHLWYKRLHIDVSYLSLSLHKSSCRYPQRLLLMPENWLNNFIIYVFQNN